MATVYILITDIAANIKIAINRFLHKIFPGYFSDSRQIAFLNISRSRQMVILERALH